MKSFNLGEKQIEQNVGASADCAGRFVEKYEIKPVPSLFLLFATVGVGSAIGAVHVVQFGAVGAVTSVQSCYERPNKMQSHE